MTKPAKKAVTVDPQTNDTLENELTLVYKAIANTRNGIVITDHLADDEPIIYTNQAFIEMSGYSRSEILGRNCRFMQGSDRDQIGREELAAAISSGSDLVVELRNYRKDGTLFWNELTLSPVRNSEGVVTHFIGVQNDVTRRKVAEDDLRAERDQLESHVDERTQELMHLNAELRRSNIELQDFAYVASHDLQEPLRKIQAFGNLLSEEQAVAVNHEAALYIDRMQDAAGRMRTLITDLLAYSRVTTNARSFEQVDLNSIASEVLRDMETSIEEAQGHIDAGPLPTLQADPSQMRQLLQNLISNALKFRRPDFPPRVTIRSQQALEQVTLTVSDNGIGFDNKFVERIFTIFQRLHGKEEYGGTGIGLSVVRKIIERHNGTITADGQLGIGATFTITLPVRQSSTPTQSTRKTS